MNLGEFYRKIRKIAAEIAETDAIIVSLATPDGGKPGVRTEVPRQTAARLVVENRARLASPEEAEEFRKETAAAKQELEQAEAAKRMQIAVIPETELRALRQEKTRR